MPSVSSRRRHIHIHTETRLHRVSNLPLSPADIASTALRTNKLQVYIARAAHNPSRVGPQFGSGTHHCLERTLLYIGQFS